MSDGEDRKFSYLNAKLRLKVDVEVKKNGRIDAQFSSKLRAQRDHAPFRTIHQGDSAH